MDMLIVNDKAKQLCDVGACCSMAEARRIVMCGGFGKVMKRTQQKEIVENQDNTQQTNGDADAK